MDLSAEFKKMGRDLSILAEDTAKIALQKSASKIDHKKEKNEKGMLAFKGKKISHSLKSLQPMTRIYKNKEEIKSAKEDPGMAHIMGKIKDIFEGN